MDSTRRSPGRARDTVTREAAGAAVAARPSNRGRWWVLAGVVGVSVVAWAYLVYMHDAMSGMPGDGMSPMPWTAADAWYTFAMWTVMMAAMMAAPAAPAMLLFGGMQSKRSGRRLPLAVLLFALGYAIVWIGFSVLATLLQWLLHEASLLTPAMTAASSRLGGAILVVAGVYQFTPLQRACLRHCRTPLGFFMTHWRDGASGALAMGVGHGLYCLGCCWALMLVLFAVGVMNLAWVAALTVLVLLEKAAPGGQALARIAGAVLVGTGTALLLGLV